MQHIIAYHIFSPQQILYQENRLGTRALKVYIPTLTNEILENAKDIKMKLGRLGLKSIGPNWPVMWIFEQCGRTSFLELIEPVSAETEDWSLVLD